MSEPTVQVSVSLIERAERAVRGYNDNYIARDLQDILDALLSQPTPTAEPEHDEACVIWTGDGFTCDCGNDDESRAEPPRVEDMAPGTRFRADHWDEDGSTRPGVSFRVDRSGVFLDDKGKPWYIGDIDPSTIRDVTPPTN